MTPNEVLRLISEAALATGRYEEDRILITHFEGDTSGWVVTLKMPDGSRPSVYSGCSWGGSWCHGHFHPGGWCHYLRDIVVPKVRANLETERLRKIAERDQAEARRFSTIDDSALFGTSPKGGAS